MGAEGWRACNHYAGARGKDGREGRGGMGAGQGALVYLGQRPGQNP